MKTLKELYDYITCRMGATALSSFIVLTDFITCLLIALLLAAGVYGVYRLYLEVWCFSYGLLT